MSTDTEAMHRINTHEKVCAERYTTINQQLTTVHQRLNSLSDRMWVAALGTLSAAVVGAASLLFFIVSRGTK